MKKDEEKEFSLTFAADDPRTEYAGKEAKFKIRINEIKEEKLPELNDEFAKSISQDYQTLDALRESTKTRLKERTAEIAKSAYEESVLEAAVKQAEIEYPPVLIDSEIHRMMDERFQTREQFQAYLKSVNKTEEEVHEEFHEAAHDTAIERIKKSLVLGKISDEEKIPITDADIDADIERMLQNITGQNRDDLAKSLNRQEVRESINQRLLARKLMDKLVEIAKGPAIEAKTDKEESKE